MSSYRRYTTHKDVAKRAMRRVLRYITHKDAAERAMRQVLRHRMETYAEPFPDGSMYVQPVGVEALVRGMESIRASLENWPVPPPLFQSQTPPLLFRCLPENGHAVMMNGHCALCSYVDPAPKPKVVGYRRTGNSSILRCLDHPLPRGYETPVTSEDLENGGMCTWCGNDLLAHPGVNSDLTPREKLFRAADPADDAAFSVALNEYRDSLRAEWDAGKLDPVYCPCENCTSRRDDQ